MTTNQLSAVMTLLPKVLIAVAGFLGTTLIWAVLYYLWRKKHQQKGLAVIERGQRTKYFTLSRQDVIDHIEKMSRDTRKFPVAPSVRQRANSGYLDFLMCGDRCFGMIFAADDIVYHFTLSMNERLLAQNEKHPFKKAAFLRGTQWYESVVDTTYESKDEILFLLENSYLYTYQMPIDQYANAEADRTAIEQSANGNADKIALAADEAEKKYRSKLDRYKDENYKELDLSIYDIADAARKIKGMDVEVLEPTSKEEPLVLNVCGQTYARVYDLGGGEMTMIIRIPDVIAHQLAFSHPEICRVSAPQGMFWHRVPIDGAFSDNVAVFGVLEAACEFFGTTVRMKTAEIEAKKKEARDTINKAASNFVEAAKKREELRANPTNKALENEIITSLKTNVAPAIKEGGPKIQDFKQSKKEFAAIIGEETDASNLLPPPSRSRNIDDDDDDRKRKKKRK